YKNSCQVEITGLLEKGIFEIYIFNSRFINKIKNKGIEREFKKSRLVIQAYNNSKKYIILI
ncbi:uncharacterized protein K444DRAFT_548428, partial [Hyaloscypha bicolor E]